MKQKDQIVTWELIERLKTPPDGWNKSALAYLGVRWPPKKGWKRRILGKSRKPVHCGDFFDNNADLIGLRSSPPFDV